MPIDPERHARLYYDRSCGPCTFLAEAVAGAGHGRVESIPLDDPRAAADLADLPPEARFASAHVVRRGDRRSGAAIVDPILGFTFGTRAEQVVARFPTLDRPLRWLYDRFWEHRQRHGCGAEGPGPGLDRPR
ncbi:MAG TPA: hypothetical protein VML53_07935 [Thermoplasmata archaeon]|nr:hypothetical protein [Thermoplasmata archaeon]